MCRDCGCTTASVFRDSKVKSFHLKQELRIGFALPLELPVSQPSPDENLQRNDSAGTTSREVRVEESIFARNQAIARTNRDRFAQSRTRVMNFMSSPGSGKTSLLARLLPAARAKFSKTVLVLVGDQETSIDANRLQAAGLNAIQINTHSACHLDAARIADHLPEALLDQTDWVVIENVGNLVCPAVFDLGEMKKIAVLSVTEGEEKPLKYPVLFQDADIIVITKTDLLPYLDFDVEKLKGNIRYQNPRAPIVFCSTKTGEGFDELLTVLQEPLEVN